MLSPSEHELMNTLAEVLIERQGEFSESAMRRAKEILEDPEERKLYLKWFNITDHTAVQH